MNKEQQKIDFFTQNIKDNYSTLQSFYEYEFICFCELRSIIYDNLNCLLLGLYLPCICTTTYLLERMLKLALYNFETKGCHIGDDNFSSQMEKAKNQYDSKTLSQTIDLALLHGIITESEKGTIDELRVQFRNPYSHAEMGKIISHSVSAYRGKLMSIDNALKDLQAGKAISYTDIVVPPYAIAESIQQASAENRSKEYLVKVFNIMVAIEKRYQQ